MGKKGLLEAVRLIADRQQYYRASGEEQDSAFGIYLSCVPPAKLESIVHKAAIGHAPALSFRMHNVGVEGLPKHEAFFFEFLYGIGSGVYDYVRPRHPSLWLKTDYNTRRECSEMFKRYVGDKFRFCFAGFLCFFHSIF